MPIVGDTTFTDLPLVGEGDSQQKLTTFINLLRIESNKERGKYTPQHQEAINLYLWGNISGVDEPHSYPKIQGLVNAKVSRAARNVPAPTLRSLTLSESGPVVTLTTREVVPLTAERITDFVQHGLDVILEKSKYSKHYQTMCFYASLFGWQFALKEYDSRERRVIFRPLPALQWYVDPTVENLADMSYVGCDWPIDAEVAKRLYPHLAEKIQAASRRSVAYAPSASGYSDVYASQNWARPIVTLSIFWIRNREASMTQEEAIQAGLIELRQMEVPSATPSPAASEPAPGNPLVGNPESTSEPAPEPSLEGSSSQPPLDVMPPAPVMREALVHKETGVEVTPDHPQWPRKLILSQTVQIVDEVVDDIECEYDEIPVSVAYNVRIPNRPYGQSECVRVKSAQLDANRLNSNIMHHSEWYKGPVNILPNSVKDALPDEIRNLGIQPNSILWVPDDVLKRLMEYFRGKVMGQYDPPPMPPVLMEAKRENDRNFDVSGNRPDVSQGNAPTKNSSGELAKILLDAAQQQEEYTALSLEDMVKADAEFALQCILDWTPEEWGKYDRTYPPEILPIIINTARQMEFSVDVQPATMRYQREQQLRADWQMGFIDQETALDGTHYDSVEILGRLQKQQEAARAAAVAASVGGQSSQLQGSSAPPKASPQGSFKLAGA
jgi:hypothetical protein